MKDLIQMIRVFNEERDWSQFHSPENIAKSIVIESGELLECFQWSEDFKSDAVKEELADVMIYCLMMADKLGVSPDEMIRAKIKKNAEKYPISKARSNSRKYTEFEE